MKKEILSSPHCALPGIADAFDDASGTASVRLAVTGMPVLRDVPVFACHEVSTVDAWLSGEGATDPASGRVHSLSDAFAFVGWRRQICQR